VSDVVNQSALSSLPLNTQVSSLAKKFFANAAPTWLSVFPERSDFAFLMQLAFIYFEKRFFLHRVPLSGLHTHFEIFASSFFLNRVQIVSIHIFSDLMSRD